MRNGNAVSAASQEMASEEQLGQCRMHLEHTIMIMSNTTTTGGRRQHVYEEVGFRSSSNTLLSFSITFVFTIVMTKLPR